MPFRLPFLNGETNVMNGKFNPDNAAHVALAFNELNEFKQSRDALLEIDSKVTIGIGCDTVLYLTGFLGVVAAGAILAAIGYAAIYKADRQEHVKVFQAKLDRVMDIFHWMVKHKTAYFTHNNVFMDVAEAIAPFVQRKELMLWDFTHTKPDDLSDRYIQLLAASPHRTQFVMLKNEGILSLMSASSVVQEQAVNETLLPLKERVLIKARTAYGFFEQTHAEAKLGMYGYQAKPEEAPRPQTMTV